MTEKIQQIYTEINTLKNSLISNENKANELRKSFEKLLKLILGYDPSESKITLHDMINEYATKQQKYNLQYICHNLRKDLNQWSHDTPNKLDDIELNDYIVRYKNIIQAVSGLDNIINKEDIQSFSLELLTLNEKQKQAVESQSKITLVNAGPGTGKTHLIVGRILNELNINSVKKIFGLSFTNKASEELEHKIDDKIFLTNLADRRDNTFTGTIHSFALYFIQEYFEFNQKEFDFIIIDDTELQDIKDEFQNNTNEISDYLKENKILTFDMIIDMFLNTIKNNEKFRIFLSDKIGEIIIDEAQDLDKLQYEILYLLYQNIPNLKLFFVGDQRQNIYAFKGGSLNNIMEYFNDEKDFSYIELVYSYRCPQNILSFVNKFDFNDCKNPILSNAVNNNGNKLILNEFEDKKEEASWIAKQIITKKSEGVKLKDIAIIWSNTFYFQEILETLNNYEISFKVFGGQYILSPYIKLLRLVINLINTNNNYVLKSIQNFWINTELNGENIDDILVPLSDMDFSKKESYEKLYKILKFIKLKQSIEVSVIDIISDFIALVDNEIMFDDKVIEEFTDLKLIIENDLLLDNYDKFKLSFSPNHPELGKFYSRSDEIVQSECEDSSNFVTVTTIHSAKGLEWDNIIIPGMAQDSFPRWFADEKTKQEELPNELKKFYVACTRAKSNLYFTRPKNVTIKSKKNGQYYTFERAVSIFMKGL